MKRKNPVTSPISIFVVLVIAALALLTACAPAPTPAPVPTPTPQSTTLLWASGGTPTAFRYNDTIKLWMDSVTRLTNGNVKFKDAQAGTVLKDPEMLEGISSKVADMGFIGAAWFPKQMPEFNLAGLGTAFEEAKKTPYEILMITRILLHEFPSFQEHFEKAGVMQLFITATEPQVLISAKPVSSLNDLKGMRLRISAKYYGKLFPFLGAEGIQVGMGEVYSGIQKGIIDGTLTNASSARDFKYYEVAKHITLFYGGRGMMFAIAPFGHYMNLQLWNSLPPDVRLIMLEIGKWVEIRFGMAHEFLFAEAVADMVAQGVTKHQLPDEDSITWSKLAEPFFDEVANEMNAEGVQGAKLVARYKELRNMSRLQLEELFNKAWEARFAALK
ncbi:MAG: TRAP transporter substrate-binding protein DctP [Chloroflexi bacterium]|nr:TRAP transporter substrate-binding protein DctP [Chloroflexota bacterium]